jgi:predicted nucleic acid binding AN1-type Zn finger protein
MNSPAKKKKKLIPRCFTCKEKVNPTIAMIGKCKFCEYIYCNTHRLPESHSCINQRTCNQEAFDINSKKNGEAANFKKVVKI